MRTTNAQKKTLILGGAYVSQEWLTAVSKWNSVLWLVQKYGSRINEYIIHGFKIRNRFFHRALYRALWSLLIIHDRRRSGQRRRLPIRLAICTAWPLILFIISGLVTLVDSPTCDYWPGSDRRLWNLRFSAAGFYETANICKYSEGSVIIKIFFMVSVVQVEVSEFVVLYVMCKSVFRKRK